MNSNFINRIFRAARLDAHLYEEVEADKTSMRQAMLVVILSGVAAGVGSISHGGYLGIAAGTVTALDRMVYMGISYLFDRNQIPA